jgi:hypothetical protein
LGENRGFRGLDKNFGFWGFGEKTASFRVELLYCPDW